MQTHRLKLRQLGVTYLRPNNGNQLMWEDVHFRGTGHAGECDDTVRLRRNTINIACDYCLSPSPLALRLGTPLTSHHAPATRPSPPYYQVPPPLST